MVTLISPSLPVQRDHQSRSEYVRTGRPRASDPSSLSSRQSTSSPTIDAMPPVRSEPAPFTPADIAYQMAHADDTQVPRIVSISVLLIVLTVVAVMLRFVARSMRKLPWGLDDYFMVPSLVSLSPRANSMSFRLTEVQFFTVMLCVENLICR